MPLSGTLNGTDVVLAVEDSPGGGTYTNVGGVISNSFTANNGAIDLTNKSAAGWREIMAGAGLQSVDISAEIIFSSDTPFGLMKTSSDAQTLLSYRIARGSDVLEGLFKIVSWAETAPDNDKVTVSVSLQSSEAVTGL